MNTATTFRRGLLRGGLTRLVPALLAALVLLAAPAFAEDEGGGVEEKIKKKMQEILRLMRENEKALLELSTGADAKTRRVDVEVPNPPGKGGETGGGGSPSGAGSGEGLSGEDIARKLRELVEGARSRGKRIPSEMESLIRMIPKKQGKGQGSGEPKPNPETGEQGEKQPSEANDLRKRLDQEKRENRRRKEDGEPKGGQESPDDPARRLPNGGKPDDPLDPHAKRDDAVNPWFAALPPEIRDAVAGGRTEDIPARYRALIRRYHEALNKKAAAGRSGR